MLVKMKRLIVVVRRMIITLRRVVRVVSTSSSSSSSFAAWWMCLSIDAEKGLWAEKVMFWSGLCLSEFLCHCGIQFLLYFKCVCVFISFFIYVVRQLLVWMLETMVQNIVFETARDRSSVTWVDHFSALSTFFGRSWLYINSGISRMLYSL